MSKEEIIRERIVFSGRVQGVGFRFRARMAAEGLHLTGWVRNCFEDETVEMEVQGTREAINQMIFHLSRQRYIWIDGIQREEIPVRPRDSRFSVLY